jgi:hypothetical protein
MVWAVAILDDGERREKERRRKIEQHRNMELQRKAAALYNRHHSRRHTAMVLNALSHSGRQCLFGFAQVISHLRVHPEFRRRIEKRPQPDRGISGDASLILQDRRTKQIRH